MAAERSSVVRLGLWGRSLFIKPKPVNYIITPMNIESRTEVSGGRVTVHGGPLDQRVANLESDVDAIWERLEKAKSDLRKLRYDAEKGLENAETKSQEAENSVSKIGSAHGGGRGCMRA